MRKEPDPQPDPEADADDIGDGEPIFAGRPLSALAGLTDQELLAIEGIGAGTVKKIRAAQGE